MKIVDNKTRSTSKSEFRTLPLLTLLCTLLAMLMVACGDDQDEHRKKPAETYKMFHHRLEQGNRVNIFQMVRFRIKLDEDKYFRDAAEGLNDSVIWKLEGTNHMMRFTESNAEEISYYGFQYLFTKPGHYRSIMEWYHNRELVDADTVEVDVVDEKPFMNYDFDTGVNETVKNPVDLYEYVFHLWPSHMIPQGMPNIFMMTLYTKDCIFNDEFFQFQRQALYDLIEALYGKPTYTTESADMDKISYDIYGLDNTNYQPYMSSGPNETIHPEAMWLSPKCYITLVRRHFTAEDWIVENWDPNAYPYPIHDEYILWAIPR